MITSFINSKSKSTLFYFWIQNSSFHKHIHCLLNKTSKIIGLIGKIKPVILKATLLTIYKYCLRPDLDYEDNCAFNTSVQNKLESVQYNAALSITGTIKGSSREKRYDELALILLKSRQWYQKFQNEAPFYLFWDNSQSVINTSYQEP